MKTWERGVGMGRGEDYTKRWGWLCCIVCGIVMIAKTVVVTRTVMIAKTVVVMLCICCIAAACTHQSTNPYTPPHTHTRSMTDTLYGPLPAITGFPLALDVLLGCARPPSTTGARVSTIVNCTVNDFPRTSRRDLVARVAYTPM